MDSANNTASDGEVMVALRKVLGDCVDSVANADMAVRAVASSLRIVLLDAEIIEELSKFPQDPLRWIGAHSEIHTAATEAINKLRPIVAALHVVCPPSDPLNRSH